MNYDELSLILSTMDIPDDRIRKFGAGTQVQIPCPLAPWLHTKKTDTNPSLSIKFNIPGKWTVFKCWSCKEAGKLSDLIDSLGRFKEDDKLLELANRLSESDKPSLSERFGALEKTLVDGPPSRSATHVPPLHSDALDRHQPAYNVSRSREYLERRKVTSEVSEHFTLLYDSGKDRIIFPVKSVKGDLVGAVGRAIENETHPRYFNYFGFAAGNTLGGVELVDRSRPYICVVEGFFDVLNSSTNLSELGCDTVCTWRAEMSQEQAKQLLSLDKTIIIGYDMDSAGNDGWLKAKKLLHGEAYGLKRLTWSDLTVDMGEMPRDQLRSLFTSLKGELR